MQHNLELSTDPNPAKSESKCIYFTGKARNVVLPEPLHLRGEQLPWVTTVEHLGHTLQQDCTIDLDDRRKRASFIDKSSDIRDTFHFAHPEQVMKLNYLLCSNKDQ